MERLEKYYKKYKELEASYEVYPLKPKAGMVQFTLYLIAQSVICWAKGPDWLLAANIILFLLIYYNVRRDIQKAQERTNKPRSQPRD